MAVLDCHVHVRGPESGLEAALLLPAHAQAAQAIEAQLRVFDVMDALRDELVLLRLLLPLQH